MNIEKYIILDNNEVNELLSYRLIAECTHCSCWKSGSIKRKLEIEFSEEELWLIAKIVSKVYRWIKLKHFCEKNLIVGGYNYE